MQSGTLVRRIALALLALLLVLLLAAGGSILWLTQADLRPVLERHASEALGRRVTVGSLQIHWGNPLGVEVRDLVVANASWGSKPDMVQIGQVSALVDLGPLVEGTLRYERLRIADARIVLERDEHGNGNWKFDGGGSGPGLVPKTRAEFPTLVDFAGERGLVTYRTRSGKVLGIRLDHVEISSRGEETPVRLLAQGAYNKVPLQLDATTDSYAVLRDASTPFGAHVTLQGKDTNVAFNGTLSEPLDFEGARGELSIEARTLDDLAGVFGAERKVDLPLSIAGNLRRDGDHWALAAAKGRLKDSDFSGSLALQEGEAGKPDDIALDLDFGILDLDQIVGAFTDRSGPTNLRAMPLRVGAGGTSVSASLTAQRAIVGGRKLNGAALQGRLAGDDVSVKELRFALGGGTLEIAGTLSGEDAARQLKLQARLSQADLSDAARELGRASADIDGRLEGSATLSMVGQTAGGALKNSEGAVLLSLRDGTVARSLIERLSTDLRSLFRSKEDRVPLSCTVGVITIRKGIGVISPLRMVSRDAIVIGAGKIDLAERTLDMTVQTERDSTSFFALDIPVRISGPIDHLSAKPLVGSNADWLKQHNVAVKLPPELRPQSNDAICGMTVVK
jgi:AsmA family protein